MRTDTLEIGADAGLNIPGTEEDRIYSNDVVNIQEELKESYEQSKRAKKEREELLKEIEDRNGF